MVTREMIMESRKKRAGFPSGNPAPGKFKGPPYGTRNLWSGLPSFGSRTTEPPGMPRTSTALFVQGLKTKPGLPGIDIAVRYLLFGLTTGFFLGVGGVTFLGVGFEEELELELLEELLAFAFALLAGAQLVIRRLEARRPMRFFEENMTFKIN